MNGPVKNLSDVVDYLHDGLYIVDLNKKILFWNKSAESMTGFTVDEVVGSSCSDNVLTHVDNRGNSLCEGMCPLAETLVDGKVRESELFLHHKKGHRIRVSVRTVPNRDPDGTIVGGIELFTDLSSRDAIVMKMKELEKLAMLDKLTKLANRNYIEMEFTKRFHELKRHNNPFGILFMDIDNFKSINDSFGHNAGDLILQAVANTFRVNTRPYDLFGRWGGEEFVGIFPGIDEPGLQELGDRFRMLIESSYVVNENKTIHVTISTGGTLGAISDTIESVIERADQALYASKSAGRNRVTLKLLT
jgi:diguanylate cyclase (GGDEF)-like protein/PAS domain S-box-containing protein